MPRSSAGVVLTAAGAAGLLLGAALPHWQWTLEHAQILAGIVSYPPDSPLAIAHARVWSLVPQLCALALKIGVSERALTIVLSALIGGLSFAALSAITLALSRRSLLAFAAPFLIFVARATDYGDIYPIMLVDTPHTYGAIGLSFSALALGLCGLGWTRAGWLLLGLAPAVHLPNGAFALLIGFGGFGQFGGFGRFGGLNVPWVAAGLGISAVSFAAHSATSVQVAPIDAATASRYLHAFVAVWDGHRQQIGFYGAGVKLTIVSVLLATALLAIRRMPRDESSPGLLRALAVAGIVSLALAAWTRLPELMPDDVLVLMPGRFLNLSIFCAPVLLLAGAASLPARLAGPAVTIVTAALLTSGAVWTFTGPARPAIAPHDVMIAAAGVLIVLFVAVRRPHADLARLPWQPALVSLLVIAAALTLTIALAIAPQRLSAMADYRTDPVLAQVHQGTGPLLTGGDLFVFQARTRRALLIDGSTLDTLPYALESGPAIDRMLREIYDLDLFHPPPEARNGGRIPAHHNRVVWESFDLTRWRRIRDTYGITDVLVPAGWQLALPSVAKSAALELFRIQ